MTSSDDFVLVQLAERILDHTKHLAVPNLKNIYQFVDTLHGTMFPPSACQTSDCSQELFAKLCQVRSLLNSCLGFGAELNRGAAGDEAGYGAALMAEYDPAASDFMAALPELFDALKLDAQAHLDMDPAATSLSLVVATYPGFRAISYYRYANVLHLLGVQLIPRIITEYAHQLTGIDIHPAAKIGRSFAIDHGTGVVIGETSTIGDHVRLYQGVTLGALSVSKAEKSVVRHPTIQDNVTIYANATILGGSTVIGEGSVIGGNAWIIQSVAPHSKVYWNK